MIIMHHIKGRKFIKGYKLFVLGVGIVTAHNGSVVETANGYAHLIRKADIRSRSVLHLKWACGLVATPQGAANDDSLTSLTQNRIDPQQTFFKSSNERVWGIRNKGSLPLSTLDSSRNENLGRPIILILLSHKTY